MDPNWILERRTTLLYVAVKPVKSRVVAFDARRRPYCRTEPTVLRYSLVGDPDALRIFWSSEVLSNRPKPLSAWNIRISCSSSDRCSRKVSRSRSSLGCRLQPQKATTAASRAALRSVHTLWLTVLTKESIGDWRGLRLVQQPPTGASVVAVERQAVAVWIAKAELPRTPRSIAHGHLRTQGA
jgi:hypothetical protein